MFAAVLVVAAVPSQDLRQLPSRLASDAVITPSETTPEEHADSTVDEPARGAPAGPEAEPADGPGAEPVEENAEPAEEDNAEATDGSAAGPQARVERRMQAECDPAYPGLCLPPEARDLDCPDVPERDFRVETPDPHDFDRDRDRIGCESD